MEFIIKFITFIPWSVLEQVLSIFQNEFSIQCDLLLLLSIPRTLSFPEGHPVASYVFFLVLSSLLSFLSFNNTF